MIKGTKLIRLDAWTRRNFHHAPVSMDFKRSEYLNPSRPSAPRIFRVNGHRQFLQYVEFGTPDTPHPYHYILFARLNRRSPIGNGEKFIVFDKWAQGKISHDALNSDALKYLHNELAEKLSREFHSFLKANAAREIIQGRNAREWRNMA